MAKIIYILTMLIAIIFISYFYGLKTFLIIFSLFIFLFIPVVYCISKVNKG
ncbi:cellulose synthase/poly-beta-1,6-N-acetylglucosamine synthase-like glycosyltransferase [Bacillus benzoevorans]|uniref:Cellulose synthase/poly-beta-1,6-N-acetylglucosamine synthase-like glycosyltransferase n=1 Tax=Bacillus benzoevorans TaxID=1456 RepID=A0A7X0HQB5_9BACI|nr:cellulose synthase/poly-beta-1,6-N-acetylglucosamine synthase-like glycosyltransferase [Bacillus benzoevorans]